MKYIGSIIVFLLIFGESVQAQDLSGHWEGRLPQRNKPYDFKLELDVQQKGDSLHGRSKLTSPADQAYVILEFKGKMSRRGRITLKEYEIVDNIKTGNLDWCIKTLRGDLTLEKENGKMVIKGTWSSNRMYSEERGYYPSVCAPGQFEVYKDHQFKEKVLKMVGVIYDNKTKKGVQGDLLLAPKVGDRQKTNSNQSGEYATEVKPQTQYTITITAAGYQPYTEAVIIQNGGLLKNFYLDPEEEESKPQPVKEPIPEEKPIVAAPEEFALNTKIILEHVLFKQSTSDILPESNAELEKLYQHLLSHPKHIIKIEGHTDRIGSAAKNLELSEKRAEAIKSFLTKKGIKPRRISTKGYGHMQTICRAPCKENRRVEFIISKE